MERFQLEVRIKGRQKVGHFVDAVVAHRSLLLVGKATYSRITLENSVQSADDAIGNKIEHKLAISVV